MNPKIVQLAALVLALCSVGVAWAESQQDKAKQWLERMLQAPKTFNYEGTFVYVQGQVLEAMHIVHSSKNGERQRIVSLNGSVREVVVANDKVTCLLPGEQPGVKGGNYNRSPFPIALPQELDKLERYYQFATVGDDRVAARKTQVIAIEPRDKLRFGYRLWLDHETGIMLRSALLDEVGRIVEQLMFTQLQVKPEIDEDLLSPSKPLSPPSSSKTDASEETVERSDWEIAQLPPGFIQVMHKRYWQSSGKRSTEHIVFTDGLATISVFLEELDGAQPLLIGASRMGAMNAFGAVIAEHQAVVVGEVPQATVELIASSLQYTPGATTE